MAAFIRHNNDNSIQGQSSICASAFFPPFPGEHVSVCRVGERGRKIMVDLRHARALVPFALLYGPTALCVV